MHGKGLVYLVYVAYLPQRSKVTDLTTCLPLNYQLLQEEFEEDAVRKELTFYADEIAW